MRTPRRRVPVRLQSSMAECGAASLAMMLSALGRSTSVREMRERLGVGRDGSNASALVRVAGELGVRTDAFRCTPENLHHITLPALAHWRDSHFVVVERWSPRGAWIVDPALGRQRLDRAAFDDAYSGVVLQMTRTEEFAARHGAGTGLIRFVWRYLPRQAGLFWLVLAASAVLIAVGLVPPTLTRYVVDRVVEAGRPDLMWLLASAAGVLVAGQALVGYLRRELLLRLRTRLDLGMMGAFLGHLFRLPYRYFQLRTSGDLLTRVSSSAMLREVASTQAFTLILDSAAALVYTVLLWQVWPVLALLVLGLAAVQVAIAVAYTLPVRRAVDRELTTMAASQSQLVEAITGIESLKAAGAERVALERWELLYRRQLSATMRQGTLRNAMDALLDVTRFGAPVALLLVGAHAVLAGQLSLGTMLAANLLAGMALSPITSLSQVYQSLQMAGTHVERLRDVLEEQPEQEQRADLRRDDIRGAIELRRVSFRYQRDARPAVENLDLTVPEGGYLAIVGTSGSGKSTLARLLVGLYPPDEGEILFDKVPVADFDLTALRRQCGIVVQDAAVYSGTILDNVTINAPDAPFARVVEAATLAGLHDDVARMPLGYATPLGEGGGGLSGGQRQRLALARALICQPRVLVLDEATSHLDSRTEALIHDNLTRMRATRIVVAHRLSTVVSADLILVMRHGRVIERGRHDELLALGGAYAELVRAQVAPEMSGQP